ncbi:MAG: phosphoribosylformylglycinamidine cyclo-ligase [Candidatus Caenarcaniphilales bacterium]|nr:phosphoribosylformylglycinamidine cyclo-ligase [Candidatus Caenarcaniphilales bacterium]
MSSYASAGVDIDAGNKTVDLIKSKVAETHNSSVLTGLGSFGALFDLKEIVNNYDEPVLVQSIDGVGTKLIIAEMAQSFYGVGQDIVNHSINDILVMGAKPLTFLDYVANEKLKPEIVAEMVSGMADACKESGMALVGGETAEMPGTYLPGQHDIAGTITGVVEKSKIITGEKISEGDIIIGIASNGLHTNGYSLARKIFFSDNDFKVESKFEELGEENLGEALLKPHLSYSKIIHKILDSGIKINGMSHITGGGFYENLVRVLPDNLSIEIQSDSWEIPPIFKLIEKLGKEDEREMFRVFNMGIGLCIMVPESIATHTLKMINNESGHKAYLIGYVKSGAREVDIN